MVIFSKDVHIHHVDEIRITLVEEVFILNLKYCLFSCDYVDYFGCIIKRGPLNSPTVTKSLSEFPSRIVPKETI